MRAVAVAAGIVACVLLLPLSAVAPAVERAGGTEQPAEAALAELSQVLDLTAVPPGWQAGGCSRTMVHPGVDPVEVTCPDGEAAAQQASGSALALEEVASFETPRGWAELAPLGAEGAVVRVHGLGAVAAMDAAGETAALEEFTIDDARAYIVEVTWRFAKTMPKWPHEYTVRGWRADLEERFVAFVELIRRDGEVKPWPRDAKHPRHHNTYLVIDGWQYWSMEAPVDQTTVVNRAQTQTTAWGCNGWRCCERE